MNVPNCPDCNVLMEEGHILDHNHGVSTYSRWQPGPVSPESFLGMMKIPGSAQTDRLNGRQIVSYCCPECGLLREYALKKE